MQKENATSKKQGETPGKWDTVMGLQVEWGRLFSLDKLFHNNVIFYYFISGWKTFSSSPNYQNTNS